MRYDKVRFCSRPTRLVGFVFCASSLKQQSADRLGYFSLMLRALRGSKNTNFYSLLFDILYRIEKWYSAVSSGQSPRSECHSFSQVDPRFLVDKLTYQKNVYKPLALRNFRECFKVNFKVVGRICFWIGIHGSRV